MRLINFRFYYYAKVLILQKIRSCAYLPFIGHSYFSSTYGEAVVEGLTTSATKHQILCSRNTSLFAIFIIWGYNTRKA